MTGFRQAMATAARVDRRGRGLSADADRGRSKPTLVRFRGRFLRIEDAVVVLGRLSAVVAAEITAAGFVLIGEDAGRQLWIRHR